MQKVDFESTGVFLKGKKKKDSFLEQENRWDIFLRVDGPGLICLAVQVNRQAWNNRNGISKIDQ